METVGEVVPGQHGGRPVLKSNGQTRIALPMHYIESCVSKVESDFLWRFFEACDFAEGSIQVLDKHGEPLGRYADHADTVDPQTYVRMEVEAYKWVLRLGLGREWATIAQMFLRMMADQAKISFIDWGSLLTNSDDAKISTGGAQVSMRMLGIRLKDAYRDFFRWYRYVHECQTRGIEPSGAGAYASLEREKRVALDIQQFKQRNGLMPPAPKDEQDNAGVLSTGA